MLEISKEKPDSLNAKCKNAKPEVLEGTIIGDLWGYISDVDDGIVKIFGANDKNEFAGKHFLEFIAPEERSCMVKATVDSINSDQTIINRHRAVSKNGEEMHLEVTRAFLRDENGAKTGFISTVRKMK